ncbi:MAG: hypothetical protein LBG18_09215 [Mediterranea sp.]|jgi:hypothetical protein|nr:hypothetical protein [Mediterranea sp.]
MGIKKKKISALPLAESLVGLFTIGVDSLNRSVKVGLQFLKTAADNANTATTAASQAANSANQATVSANNAATNANTKAGLANDKATEANEAAALANQKVTEANDTIIIMQELAESLVGQYKLIPTGIELEYPQIITFRNTETMRITYTLLPANTGRNVLFLGDDNAVTVTPDGSFVVKKPGISRIFVIPTENTNIYKTIEIMVIEPALRKITSNSLRFVGNGNLRLT